MIRIERPAEAPAPLTTTGATRTQADCLRYDAGDRTFTFSEAIYKHALVREALEHAQHRKCCYCERLVGADGDVEHFRPKGSVQQATGEARAAPAYFWLAYEWSNLFLSCGPCNSRRKRVLFPLRDPAHRACSHHDDLTAEAPLFVKPDEEDPADHIGFRADVPFAKTDRGAATIEALALDRGVLCEARLGHLQTLMLLSKILALAPQRLGDAEFQREAERARERITDYLSDRGEFAACTRAAHTDDFEFVLPPA